MRLNRHVIAASAVAMLLSATAAMADDAPAATPAPATPAAAAPAAPAAATPAPAAQPAPVAEVPAAVKAWAKFCDPDPADKHIVCIVRKLAFDGTSIVGSFVLRIDTKKGVPTLAIAAVPVGMVLKPGLKWQIDGAKAAVLPFWRCTPQTCESEQLTNADFIARLRKGTTLKLTAKNVNGKDFVVNVPLAGFSAAYDMQNPPTFEQYNKSLVGAK